MSTLRSRQGCPWDRAQSLSSLKKHLIEEAYEVCDAIDAKDARRLKDELGDLLFLILFHAQVSRERGTFDINEIVRSSYKKMLRRHPHVFGKRKARGPDEAYRRWEEKKDRERKNKKTENGLLRGIPKALPALLKAQKVSKRAAWLGLSWPGIQRTCRSRKKHASREEIGAQLFRLATLARFQGIDAEDALNRATKKFVKRFTKAEKVLKRKHKNFGALRVKELDSLWNLRT